MKTTLISTHGASAAPRVVVLPAATPVLGTGASAALLLGTAALRFRTGVDGSAVAAAGVDAAPPPRGAPV